MKEYRCRFCHKLLFKYDKKTDIQLEKDVEVKTGIVSCLEILCPKCKYISKIAFKFNAKDWRFGYGSSS